MTSVVRTASIVSETAVEDIRTRSPRAHCCLLRTVWSSCFYSAAKVAPLEVSTCMELFALDVHVHGKYYLAGDGNATSCHFYGGSFQLLLASVGVGE